MEKWIGIAVVALVVVLTVAAPVAEAQNIWEGAWCGGTSIITTGGPTGPCGFCDGLIVASNIIRFLFQISIVIAVGMIIWGAFQLMTAGGSEERVSGGKKTITAALTGLVIALAAWLIVNELLHLLSGRADFPWSQISCIP